MKALKFILAGGIAAAAISAAPAAAQYYPGQGYPGYGYGNPGYGVPGGYGYDQQSIINQCVGAVQARLNGGAGGYGYNGYGGAYGYGGARVLGISRVEPRSNGGLTVRGVANSGRYAGYGYG